MIGAPARWDVPARPRDAGAGDEIDQLTRFGDSAWRATTAAQRLYVSLSPWPYLGEGFTTRAAPLRHCH